MKILLLILLHLCNRNIRMEQKRGAVLKLSSCTYFSPQLRGMFGRLALICLGDLAAGFPQPKQQDFGDSCGPLVQALGQKMDEDLRSTDSHHDRTSNTSRGELYPMFILHFPSVAQASFNS